MKSLWNSFKAAFAMFSKIPMPMVDWKKENIKFMMCFFPFVGTAIGILTWLAGGVLGVHVALEPFFLAVILTVIPVFITGGIHVDGLLDTSDALSSWQERTRRLEILKDSHAGAFAIIISAARITNIVIRTFRTAISDAFLENSATVPSVLALGNVITPIPERHLDIIKPRLMIQIPL